MFAQFTSVRFKLERPETNTPEWGARSRREPFRHPWLTILPPPERLHVHVSHAR